MYALHATVSTPVALTDREKGALSLAGGIGYAPPMSERTGSLRYGQASWELIEPEVARMYVETDLPVKEIAARFGVSPNAVYMRASRNRWRRTAKSSAASDVAHEVANKIASEKQRKIPKKSDAITTEIISSDIAGELGGQVLARHRRDLKKLRKAVQLLTQQLIESTVNSNTIEEDLEDYFRFKAEQDPLMAAAYRTRLGNALAAVSLGGRSKIALNVSNALAKVIDCERKAYRIEDDGETGEYEKALLLLAGKTTN